MESPMHADQSKIKIWILFNIKKKNLEILIFFQMACLQHARKSKKNMPLQNITSLPSIGRFLGEIALWSLKMPKNEKSKFAKLEVLKKSPMTNRLRIKFYIRICDAGFEITDFAYLLDVWRPLLFMLKTITRNSDRVRAERWERQSTGANTWPSAGTVLRNAF